MKNVVTLRKIAFLGFIISTMASLIPVILLYIFFNTGNLKIEVFKIGLSLAIIGYIFYLYKKIQILDKTTDFLVIRNIESFTTSGVVVLFFSIFSLLWISLFLTDGQNDAAVIAQIYFIWSIIFSLAVTNTIGHFMIYLSAKRLKKHYSIVFYESENKVSSD